MLHEASAERRAMRGRASSVAFHRPADVARILHCSEWWVKEQARRRRIPYAWIGGSYLFTEEHVAEIIRRFEVRPVEEADPASVLAPPARRSVQRSKGELPVRLRARSPRRAGAATSEASAA